MKVVVAPGGGARREALAPRVGSAAAARTIHADLDPADAHDGVALDVRVGVGVAEAVVRVVHVERAAVDVAILFFRCRIGVGVTEDVGLADSPPACIGVGVRLVHLAVLALRAAAVSREERPGSRALQSHEVARVLGTVEAISAMR